jgi:perosamine synthetase
MSTNKILYTKPSITELEVEYATDAARNGWGEQCYAYIERFEKLFAEHIQTPYAIATSSCTGAMHMGLTALGIGPGDEVILADTNWVATAAPITYVGATPVFVDILADSWCLDPDQVERAITPRTRAIVATHLYGNLCEIDRLLDIGRRYGVAVIEDAAEAIGSRWRDKPAGSQGIFGTFSFHGTKTVTTGEGGMFVTHDRALYDRVMTLNNHGRVPGGKQFWPDFIGFKYRISNVQAAIGCAQLERIDSLIARKREIFAAYRERLGSLAGVALNPEPPHTQNGYWMPTVVFAPELGITREHLLAEFAKRNIDARVFFYPLSQTELFGAPACNTPNSYAIAERAINLPSYHDMSLVDIDTVADTVRAIAHGAG